MVVVLSLIGVVVFLKPIITDNTKDLVDEFSNSLSDKIQVSEVTVGDTSGGSALPDDGFNPNEGLWSQETVEFTPVSTRYEIYYEGAAYDDKQILSYDADGNQIMAESNIAASDVETDRISIITYYVMKNEKEYNYYNYRSTDVDVFEANGYGIARLNAESNITVLIYDKNGNFDRGYIKDGTTGDFIAECEEDGTEI